MFDARTFPLMTSAATTEKTYFAHSQEECTTRIWQDKRYLHAQQAYQGVHACSLAIIWRLILNQPWPRRGSLSLIYRSTKPSSHCMRPYQVPPGHTWAACADTHTHTSTVRADRGFSVRAVHQKLCCQRCCVAHTHTHTQGSHALGLANLL